MVIAARPGTDCYYIEVYIERTSTRERGMGRETPDPLGGALPECPLPGADQCPTCDFGVPMTVESAQAPRVGSSEGRRP